MFSIVMYFKIYQLTNSAPIRQQFKDDEEKKNANQFITFSTCVFLDFFVVILSLTVQINLPLKL